MNPRPLPKKLEAKWGDWPTFDSIKEANPGLKLHQLRSLLKAVKCYRCPDASVRYVPEQVSAALLDLPKDPDRDEDEDDDDDLLSELRPPKSYDALVLVREIFSQLRESRKERRDTIEVMEKPMHRAIEMLDKLTARMEKRLDYYESQHDRMILTTEALLSEQSQRDRDAQRTQDQAAFRKHAMATLEKYGPQMLAQLKPSALASLALRAVSSLEPEMVDTLLNTPGILEPEQVALFRQLRDAIFAKQQPPNGQTQQQNPNHSAQPPS